MSQDRQIILFNGIGKGPEARQGGAFNMREQPVIVGSAGLTGPVTLQVYQPETGLWFDLMANAMPIQLTPENTFRFLTIEGTYRIKPGEASGLAVIWCQEVSHVPEWNTNHFGEEGAGGNAGAGGGSITLPVTWTNLDGSIAGRVGQP